MCDSISLSATNMSNHEKVEERKLAYRKEIAAIMDKYTTYHYKNTCSMGGAVGVAPNTEFLTGDKAKVNCPFCISYLNRKK